MKDSVPTQEADIYAFGLVIFQVHQQVLGYRQFFFNTLLRSSRVKSRSVVFDKRS